MRAVDISKTFVEIAQRNAAQRVSRRTSNWATRRPFRWPTPLWIL